jgi:hypothetical protein
MTKICPHCEIVKDDSCYYTNSGHKDGLSSWCKDCTNSRRRTTYNVAYRKTIEPRKKILYEATSRSNRRDLECNITLDDIIIPTHCPYLGIPIFSEGKNATNNSPSLDRINPKLGYVKGNVEVISHRANTLKSDGTLEEHIAIVEGLKKRLV